MGLKFELLNECLCCYLPDGRHYSIYEQDDPKYPLSIDYGIVRKVPNTIGQAKHVEEAIKIAKKHYKRVYLND